MATQRGNGVGARQTLNQTFINTLRTNKLITNDLELYRGIIINGSYGNAGQVIKSTGTGEVIWGDDVSGGGGGGGSQWINTTNGIYYSSTDISNVGIGIVNPQYRLDVFTSKQNAMRVGSSAMVVDASFNRVGINTVSPGYNLDVNGTANITGNLTTTTINSSGTVTAPTFSGSLAGNASSATTASSVTNGVYTVGDQTIGGTKTFTNTIIGDISGSASNIDITLSLIHI